MEPKKEIIIPKEKAVFRLDKNGTWHNEHGKFGHAKIIRYFHQSICKDEKGYHLRQVRDGFVEKVYFPYEETAMFVFDVKGDVNGLVLVLNTGETLALDPATLFSKNDSLYVKTGEHLIKFAQDALVKISRFLDEDQDQLCLVLGTGTYPVPDET